MTEEKKEEQMSAIDKANAAAARLEAAQKKLDEALDRQERMMVERTFGGTADAGQPQPPEESPQDYAKRVMAGKTDE